MDEFQTELANLPLLPCPFCGRAPEYSGRASTETKSGKIFFVFCRAGGYTTHTHIHGATAVEAAKAWNTRA